MKYKPLIEKEYRKLRIGDELCFIEQYDSLQYNSCRIIHLNTIHNTIVVQFKSNDWTNEFFYWRFAKLSSDDGLICKKNK